MIEHVDIEVNGTKGKLIVDGEDWSSKVSYFSVDMDAGEIPRLTVCGTFLKGKIVVDGEVKLINGDELDKDGKNDRQKRRTLRNLQEANKPVHPEESRLRRQFSCDLSEMGLAYGGYQA